MEYHKIDSVFKRDPASKFKGLLMGQYACPEFELLANVQWQFTEKVDGTNIRVMVQGWSENDRAVVQFGGRTDAASIPVTLLDRLSALFLTDEKRALLAQMFPNGAILYGEGYGAKIQKGGGNYGNNQDFVLIDVLTFDKDDTSKLWWLSRGNVDDIAQKLAIRSVPVIGSGTLDDMIALTRAGFNSAWGTFAAEGVVARPVVELKTRAGHRIIAKLKYRDFDGQGAGGGKAGG